MRRVASRNGARRASIRELAGVEPFHVAAFIKDLQNKELQEKPFSAPTVKQHLAALRMLFDWLVIGHVIDVNLAHGVRGPNTSSKKARRPCLTPRRPASCSTVFH